MRKINNKFIFMGKKALKACLPFLKQNNEDAETIIQKNQEKQKNKLDKEIHFIIESNNLDQFRYLMKRGVNINYTHFSRIYQEEEEMLKILDIFNNLEKYEGFLKRIIIEDVDEILRRTQCHDRLQFSKKLINQDKQYFSIFSEKIFNEQEVDILHRKLSTIINEIKQKDNFFITPDQRQDLKEFFLEVQKKYNICQQYKIEKIAKEATKLSESNSVITQSSLLSSYHGVEEKDIPEQCMNIYKDIKKTYLELSKHDLDIQNSQHIKVLFEKRLPQVLKEYLYIPSIYRDVLSKEVVTPEKLLESSLEEIRQHIYRVAHMVGEKKMMEMKISNTYLKSM